jgi:hypothetical protein
VDSALLLPLPRKSAGLRGKFGGSIECGILLELAAGNSAYSGYVGLPANLPYDGCCKASVPKCRKMQEIWFVISTWLHKLTCQFGVVVDNCPVLGRGAGMKLRVDREPLRILEHPAVTARWDGYEEHTSCRPYLPNALNDSLDTCHCGARLVVRPQIVRSNQKQDVPRSYLPQFVALEPPKDILCPIRPDAEIKDCLV